MMGHHAVVSGSPYNVIVVPIESTIYCNKIQKYEIPIDILIIFDPKIGKAPDSRARSDHPYN